MLFNQEYRRALDAARHFIFIGLVPLPSCMDKKRPMMKEYKHFREQSVPVGNYHEDIWKTTNLQLMTGVQTTGATKVMVVDLDGPEAGVAWKKICNKHQYTLKDKSHYPWIATTGSGGTHMYFQVPSSATACPSRMIWGLFDTLTGWVKHKEIRILGDGGLAVAPPSVRVDGSGRYKWHGHYNPANIPLPETAPGWLIGMPGVVTPDRKYYDEPETKNVKNLHSSDLRGVVLESMTMADKIAVVRGWGLRFAEMHPRAVKGWIDVHAIGREDNVPSAGFDASTGVYHEFGGEGRGISIFDLAVELGAFRTWTEARQYLHDKFVTPLQGKR